MATMIEVKGLEKSYGQTVVLRGIDLSIQEGEQCVILGASGSGKSTLLYILGGLERPEGGKVTVGGQDLAKLSDEALARYRNCFVGFVFQFHFLLPSLTALENMLLPAQIGGHDIEKVQDRVLALAKELQLQHCLNKYPFQLSGGEQQRVNLIRALSLWPKLLLCDEPTGNLDSKNSLKVTLMLKELAQEHGATLVLVTHDLKVASHFPRRLLLEDGTWTHSLDS